MPSITLSTFGVGLYVGIRIFFLLKEGYLDPKINGYI